jgi:pSer/pThr/pTyr-binding forkhead associated (FHA) protein
MQLLIIQETGAPDRAFDLFGEDVLIGRSRQCDLRLANVSVSRAHARLRWDKGNYIVEDAGSHNGVYVNGKQIKERPLVTGDQIRLGKYAIVYVYGALPRKFRSLEPETMPRWLSITVATANDETFQLTQAQMKRMVAARQLLETARLVPAGGLERGWDLGEAEWTMGRGATIPIEGLFASAKSAIIQWNGCNHVIQHAGGWAKVKVNGQPQKRRILEQGDVVDVGKTRFTYVVTT